MGQGRFWPGRTCRAKEGTKDTRASTSGLTSAGNEHCNREKSRGRLDVCQREKTSACPGRWQAGEAAGAPLCMLPGADGHLPVT